MPTTPINLGPSSINTPIVAEQTKMRERLGLGNTSTYNSSWEDGTNKLRFTDPTTGNTILLSSTNQQIAIAQSLQAAQTFNVSGDAVSLGNAAPTFNGTTPINLAITIGPSAITNSKIANGAVTPAKLSTGAPTWTAQGALTAAGGFVGNLTGRADTATQLFNSSSFSMSGAVTANPVSYNGGVTGVNFQTTISDNAITNGKISDGAVTPAKLSTGAPTWNTSGTLTATAFSGPLTGNASTASTLQTARTISLTGDATGSTSFNGGSNVSISVAINDATTSTAGKVQLANQAATNSGTSSTLAVTPATLKNSPFAAKAFVSFNGTGTPSIFGTAYNVTSVTRVSGATVGKYRITFVTGALQTSNYCVMMSCRNTASGDAALSVNTLFDGTKSATVLDIGISREGSSAFVDSSEIFIVIFENN